MLYHNQIQPVNKTTTASKKLMQDCKIQLVNANV